MTRKTARAKLPDEPRKLRPPFMDDELPFDSTITEIVKRTRRAQGFEETSTRDWRR